MRSASPTGTRESSSPCAIERGTAIFSALFRGENPQDALEKCANFRGAPLVAVLLPSLIASPIRRALEERDPMGDAKVGQPARELGGLTDIHIPRLSVGHTSSKREKKKQVSRKPCTRHLREESIDYKKG